MKRYPAGDRGRGWSFHFLGKLAGRGATELSSSYVHPSLGSSGNVRHGGESRPLASGSINSARQVALDTAYDTPLMAGR